MRYLCRVVAASLLSSLLGCASFTAKISGAPTEEQRLVLAGSTLACAGEAQRNAILLGFAGAAASAGGSFVGGLAVTAPKESDRVLFGVGGLGLLAVGLGTGIGAVVMQWNAAEYTQQAGEVLAGQETVGSCSSQPPIRVSSLPPPRSRSRTQTQPQTQTFQRLEGALGGRCYEDGTCKEGLVCSDRRRCQRPVVGGREGPCHDDGTCNRGLICNAEMKCVVDAWGQPGEEERAPRRVLSGE